MLFNSIEFALFLPIVFLLYWFVAGNSLRLQNIVLLVASYFFYGWWDWRFLLLLVGLSLANYFIGTAIAENQRRNRNGLWLLAGLFINLGVLVAFKYFNFFIESFVELMSMVGYNVQRSTVIFVLPLGISFYIFLSLSYIIDIFKAELPANEDLPEVLLALSFFPIILAGPIQRPRMLLPQIKLKRDFSFDLVVDGLKQILWGLFAKIVIADNLAPYVNEFFSNSELYTGSTLLLGAVFFTIQIYADFSGYSNMAIGIGKLFGFTLMKNFAYPYFSRDLTEFWKRWHISLTQWFRDYLFLPISFSLTLNIRKDRVLLFKTDHLIYIVASIITWFLTGLWHGANYTFILWGLFNGFILIMYHLQRKPRKKLLKKLDVSNNNIVIKASESFVTLLLIITGWILFRAETIGAAFNYISGIFDMSIFTLPEFVGRREALVIIIMILLYFLIEFQGRENSYPVARCFAGSKRITRWAFYSFLIFIIGMYMHTSEMPFIYLSF